MHQKYKSQPCYYPLTGKELSRQIGVETARMSYPGSMSRGAKQIVKAGTKFLNTFMHQLMKYKRAHPLWQKLHLPLDSRVFQSFRHISVTSPAIREIITCIGEKTAYSISRKDYKFIQENLLKYIKELNSRPGSEFKVTSRIELNYLWLLNE